MFPPVNPKISFPQLEKEILEFWRKEKIFQRSIEERGVDNPFHHKYVTPPPRKDNARRKGFTFYDGPPFATGLPHYGHILAGIIKDVVPRYQTMRGHRVERRFGWDCHGLPIENIKEKELGISGKKQIEEYGIAKFNEECRSIVQRYVHDWRALVERTGRWVDMDNDYRTMDTSYMESVWWVFKQLWDKGLVYEDCKAMQVCPRCTTPLSNFEVSQGYKEITDWSVIAKFPITDKAFLSKHSDGKRTSFLAWTTTPWSIPTTMGLAIGHDFEYVVVEAQKERFVVAASRLEYVTKSLGEGQWRVVEKVKGAAIEGIRYEHPFGKCYEKHPQLKGNANVHRTYATDYVSTEEGTGIVTINGAYGEIDMEAARKFDLPIIINVRMDGTYDETMTSTGLAGVPVKPADDPTKTDQKIAAYLEKTGFLFRRELYKHSYPHCWRCDHPLLNYATKSWFIAVTKLKNQLLKNNAQTHWVPESMRDGRFGKWLENARDWAVSRNRYWGAPLPVWRCDACEKTEAIGSLQELSERVPGRTIKLILVRHGESMKQVLQVNPSGDAKSLPLTKKGMRDAKELQKTMRQENVAAAYSSPMLRTRQTAEVFLPLGNDRNGSSSVVTDERLREIDWGKFEGVSKLDPLYLAAREKFSSLPPEEKWTYRWGDTGQTDAELEGRVQSFLDDLIAKHAGQTVVVSSHSAVLRFFVKLLRGMSLDDFYHKRETLTMKSGTSKTFYMDTRTGREFDLHKHVVDEITWKCECKESKQQTANSKQQKTKTTNQKSKDFSLIADGRSLKAGTLKRVPEVLDCWFESGSMPYAQEHYPFGNREKFEANFPADFIAEGQDQTRGWFYTLMVLSTALSMDGVPVETGLKPVSTSLGKAKNVPAFKNVIVNGIVLAEDGRKMSKKLKNYPDPSVVMEKYGADAMRWYLMASPAVAANDLRFSEKGVDEVVKSVLLPLWNAYSFFVTYANIDGWTPSGDQQKTKNKNLSRTLIREQKDGDHLEFGILNLEFLSNPLDRWILSELQTTIANMTEALDEYDLARATKPILDFLDGLTNWYIRRSRRRFWKSENDTDKNEAYATLYHVLLETTKLIAPFIPFISEEIYRGLIQQGSFSEEQTLVPNASLGEAPRSGEGVAPTWKKKIHPYNPNLVELAKQKRKEMTPAERALWNVLQKDGIRGFDFHRQKVIGNYIVDFYSPELDLVIEVDGDDHDFRSEADTVRQKYLEGLGIRVIRIANTGVKSMSLEWLEQKCVERHKEIQTPSGLRPASPRKRLEPSSVHLEEWPKADEGLVDNGLIRETKAVREIVSAALSIRAQYNIKIRQPLSRIKIAVGPELELALRKYANLFKEEINVKNVVYDNIVILRNPSIIPDAKILGKRLGKDMQTVIQMGKEGNYTKTDGGVVVSDLDGNTWVLGTGEYKVRYSPDGDNQMITEHGHVVTLETNLTPELEREGMAREIVRTIQDLRKEAGYNVSDRILIGMTGVNDQVEKEWGDYIARETLGTFTTEMLEWDKEASLPDEGEVGVKKRIDAPLLDGLL